jgi:hypothetical protein
VPARLSIAFREPLPIAVRDRRSRREASDEQRAARPTANRAALGKRPAAGGTRLWRGGRRFGLDGVPRAVEPVRAESDELLGFGPQRIVHDCRQLAGDPHGLLEPLEVTRFVRFLRGTEEQDERLPRHGAVLELGSSRAEVVAQGVSFLMRPLRLGDT